MAIHIGIDPPTEPVRMKIWVFVLLAWKDTIVRAFGIKGRTSRNAYLASVIPLILLWIALLMFGINTPPHVKIYDNVFYMIFLFAPMLFMFTLTVRRRHDISKTTMLSVVNPLNFINPLSGLFFAISLLTAGDRKDNKYGPPHMLEANVKPRTPKDDHRRIG